MPTVSRSDLYTRIHKGLRKALFDLAHAAGRTDYGNEEEWTRLKAQTAEALYFLKRHGEIEDTFFLPLLESKIPGATARDTAEHEEVDRQIDEINDAVTRLDALAAEADRREAGEEFYLLVNRFISDYLNHMHREESSMAPLYFAHCSEEELRTMLASIVAGNAPTDTMMMLRYTIPSIDPVERASFLGGIKQVAPAPAFAAMMNVVQGALHENDWERLQTDLD
jgi:hypothetical protein